MIDGERRTLAPAEGGRVRKPDTSLLDPAGEEVVIDSYWRRRLDGGDVVDKTPPPKGAGKGDV